MSEEEGTQTDETSAGELHSDEVDEQMKQVEEDPPKDLEDWPGGKAKYRTFGGAESDSGYGDGATEKLGPSDVQHHEDGSVTVKGEQVDDPDEFKSDPIPGGPTDPNAPKDPGFDEDAEANKKDS
jgi:hypothetical protein